MGSEVKGQRSRKKELRGFMPLISANFHVEIQAQPTPLKSVFLEMVILQELDTQCLLG